MITTAVAFAQKTWNELGEVKGLRGIYNATTFAYYQANQLRFTTDANATYTVSNITTGDAHTGNVFYKDNQNVYCTIDIYDAATNSVSLKFMASTNGGETFNEVGSLDQAGYTMLNVPYQLHVYSNNVATAYGKTLNSNGDIENIFVRSTDGGATWSKINLDVKYVSSVTDIEHNPDGKIILYGSQFKKMAISTDYGATWNIDLEHPLFTYGSYCDNNADKIWAIGWAGTNVPSVQKSVDGGTTFTAWSIPDASNNGIDASTTTNYGRTAMEYIQGTLLVRGERGYKNVATIYSTDEGSTWNDITFTNAPHYLGILGVANNNATAYFYTTAEELYVIDLVTSTTNTKNEVATTELKLFPNPAQEFLNFSEPVNAIVQVYTMSGQLILSEYVKGNTLAINNLKTGIYIVKTNDQLYKFVKK